MNSEESKRYYSDLISQFGPTPQGVGWQGGGQTQRLRFYKLTKDIDLSHVRSIVDVGCGYGAFLEYIKKRGFEGRYIGIDCNKESLNCFMDNIHIYRESTVELTKMDILAEDISPSVTAEYIFASGLFSFFTLKEIECVLHKLRDRFRHGLCFNFINEDDRGGYTEDITHTRADVMSVVDNIFGSAYVTIDNRYLGGRDCTVQVLL